MKLIIFFCSLVGAIIFSVYYGNVINLSEKSYVNSIFFASLYGFVVYMLYPLIARFSLASPIGIYSTFLFYYYISGIFNISEYRDYIDIGYWFSCLLVACGALFFGNWLTGIVLGNSRGERIFFDVKYPYALLIVAVLFAVYMYAKNGLLIISPEDRFGSSTVVSYMCEIAIFSVAALYAHYIYNGGSLWFIPVGLFCVIATGYRNQTAMLLLAVVFIYFLSNRDKIVYSNKSRVYFSAIVSLILLLSSLSFISRNDNSLGRTLPWQDLVRYYNINNHDAVLPFLTIHMSAREGMGVSEIALERIGDVGEFIDRKYLFFMDYLTMLPGESITPGRVLGVVVNLRDDSSLTPSILGGLSISYGMPGIFVFFLISGIIFGVLWKKFVLTRHPFYLMANSVFVVYMFELTNRGFFKPMYLFVFLIVIGFYVKNKNIRSD